MKVIFFFFLMSLSYGSIYYLQKYESTPKIKREYGFVVLDLQYFEIGEKIFININSYANIPNLLVIILLIFFQNHLI